MSAEAPRPWWATADGSAHLDDRDPLQAHREARRGPEPDDGHGADGDPSPGDDTISGDHGTGDAHRGQGHDPDVCGVCPWCAGLRMLSASHPEAVTHLTEAARHLTRAVRSIVDDLQRPGEDPEAARGDDPIERIDLD